MCFWFAITTCCISVVGVASNFLWLFQDLPTPSSPPTAATLSTRTTYHHAHGPFRTNATTDRRTTTTTDRRARHGYAQTTSYVAIVDASKNVPQERIADRICEHVVDVSVPQVVEQLFVVPKISSQTESCSVQWNRFLAVPVPRMIEQFVEVPKFVSQGRIQQRTPKQISDTLVPQVVSLRADNRNCRHFIH